MDNDKIQNIESPKGGLGSLLQNKEALLALGMGLTAVSRPGGSFNSGVMQGLNAFNALSAREMAALEDKITNEAPPPKLPVEEIGAVQSAQPAQRQSFVPEASFKNLTDSERAMASNLNFADAAFRNGDREAAMKAYEVAAEIAKRDQEAGNLHPDTLELFQDFAAEYLSN